MDTLLQQYNPPKWAEHLSHIPKWRVQLCHLNTPIQKWNLPGIPDKFTLSIKRDDMTGCAESGNKVRKLEFLFAEAVAQQCDHVITSGTITSNHCRAVATCARQLGIQPHLVMRGDVKDESSLAYDGNMLLDRLCGAEMYLVPAMSSYFAEMLDLQNDIIERIKKTTGESCYYIPVGGSNLLGTWGYIEAFNEMIKQGLHENFDDIVFACGTGGTAAGLAVANFLTGSKLRIHGIIIANHRPAYLHKHINETLDMFGIKAESEDIIELVDGHMGGGYGINTQEDLDFLVSVSTSTGILLDRVYTGKAVKGLVHEFHDSPQRFKGKRILFIHTGGVFGLYDGKINNTLQTVGKATDRVHMSPDCKDPKNCI